MSIKHIRLFPDLSLQPESDPCNRFFIGDTTSTVGQWATYPVQLHNCTTGTP